MRPNAPSRFGIYVHVPFCRRICPYCDFNAVIAKRADWGAYAQAIEAELTARAPAFPFLGETALQGDGVSAIESIYFGGGTPSLAPIEVIEGIVRRIRALLPVIPDAEVTLEVDPATVTREGYQELRRAGVTRISLGWQSTHDSLLVSTGSRTHGYGRTRGVRMGACGGLR